MAFRELGRNWIAIMDESQQREYFSNTETGIVTWDMPAELSEPVAAPALPDGWQAVVDPSSGKTYYAHPETGRTSWDVPAPDPEPAPTPAPAAASSRGASATASTTAAVSGSAASTVTARVGATLRLSDTQRAMWAFLFAHARTEALAKLQVRRKRFQGLRKFAEIAAKRKEESAAKRRADEEQEALERRRDELEAARPKRSIMQLLDVELPTVDATHDINVYAEEHFNLNRKGFFKAKTTVEKVLSWKDEGISTSLLKMPTRDLEAQAVQCFKNVTSFMGDRKRSSKDAAEHAEKLVKTCMNAPVELHDEVFCQIIKQTTNNKDLESVRAGWALLGIVAGSTSPSEEMKPFLLSYCAKALEDPSLREFSRFTMGRLLKTESQGPRKETPTIAEIEATRVMHPVLVRVYSLDGTYDFMPVTSWVTPKLLRQMICEKRGISNVSAFGIFEMTPDGEERQLDLDERVLDVIAYWHRLFEEEKAKGDDAKTKKDKKKSMGNNFYRVVFKVALYIDIPIEDVAAQHHLFVQAHFDIVSARYPCGEDDCMELAALSIYIEHGKFAPENLKDRLDRYLPAKFASGPKVDTTAVVAKLTEKCSALKFRSRAEAEQEYLKFVKEWQVYGSSFFFVEPQMSATLPSEVFLAVNPKGVLIINPETKEVLESRAYSEVPTWGHSTTSFVLHVGNLIKQTKLYFATEQGKEINDLVRAYVNSLVK